MMRSHRNEHKIRMGSYSNLALYPHPFLQVYDVASCHHNLTHFHYDIWGYETSHIWISGIRNIMNVHQTVRNSRIWSFRKKLWWSARRAYLRRHEAFGIFKVMQETPLGISTHVAHNFPRGMVGFVMVLNIYLLMQIIGIDSHQLKTHFLHMSYMLRTSPRFVIFTTLHTATTPHPKPWWAR